MAIINQHDKRSGITYVYESVSYWDKEKQQPRAKRKLIGKRDPETGEIIPTDGRGKRRNEDNSEFTQSAKPGPVPCTVTRRTFYGATYLLDAIGRKLGLTQDLKDCFPGFHKQIQSIAYYLIVFCQALFPEIAKHFSRNRHGNFPGNTDFELIRCLSAEN